MIYFFIFLQPISSVAGSSESLVSLINVTDRTFFIHYSPHLLPLALICALSTASVVKTKLIFLPSNRPVWSNTSKSNAFCNVAFLKDDWSENKKISIVF